MPGRTSSNALRYLGAAVAVAAAIGYLGFGWRFGDAGGAVPLALGAVCVVVAVGWELYRRT